MSCCNPDNDVLKSSYCHVTPQELCSLSEDLRRFRFGFELAEEGPYRIVVRLGGADVAGSPLKAKVSAAVEGLEGAGTVAEKVAQESNNTRNKVDCLSLKMNSIEISPKEKSGGVQEEVKKYRERKEEENIVGGGKKVGGKEMVGGSAEREERLSRVGKNLRSALMSVKDGLRAEEVAEQYRELVGERLDHMGLGYPTLTHLLLALPDVCRVARGVVVGVASSATEHIQNMVAKQKPSNAKGKRGGGRGRGEGRRPEGGAGGWQGGRGGMGNFRAPPFPGYFPPPTWGPRFAQAFPPMAQNYFPGDLAARGRGGFPRGGPWAMAEGAGRGGGHGAQFMENGHGFRPPFHPRGARGGHRGRGGQRPGLAPSSSAPQGLSTEPQQWKLHEYTARGEGGSLDLAARLASDPSPLPSIFCLLEGVGAADLHRPIGLCVLATGHLVVASTFENKVKMFGEDGRLVKVVVLPERPFHKPSDMVALQQGGFVVRDDQGLHLFSGWVAIECPDPAAGPGSFSTSCPWVGAASATDWLRYQDRLILSSPPPGPPGPPRHPARQARRGRLAPLPGHGGG